MIQQSDVVRPSELHRRTYDSDVRRWRPGGIVCLTLVAHNLLLAIVTGLLLGANHPVTITFYTLTFAAAVAYVGYLGLVGIAREVEPELVPDLRATSRGVGTVPSSPTPRTARTRNTPDLDPTRR